MSGAGGGEAVRDHGFPPAVVGSSVEETVTVARRAH